MGCSGSVPVKVLESPPELCLRKQEGGNGDTSDVLWVGGPERKERESEVSTVVNRERETGRWVGPMSSGTDRGREYSKCVTVEGIEHSGRA